MICLSVALKNEMLHQQASSVPFKVM